MSSLAANASTNIDLFSIMINELHNLTLRVYQMQEGKSYTEEHLYDSGLQALFVHKKRKIISVQQQLRHMSLEIYKTWI